MRPPRSSLTTAVFRWARRRLVVPAGLALAVGLAGLGPALPAPTAEASPGRSVTPGKRRDEVVGWPQVCDDPGPLLSVGVCSRAWLELALPDLLRASREVELDGRELLHLDVRSDNLCFKGATALLVDWNLACVGDGRFDVAFWLPSLRLEGGPQPWEVLPGAGALAAAVAGFFAARAGLPVPSGAPTVRAFQRRQLEVALPWAAQELGLTPPGERG